MEAPNKIILYDGREVNHGDILKLPIDKIAPNLYNPNEMSEEAFSFLEENVEQVGFVDPIVVTPDSEGNFIIIDGQHRWEQQRMSGEKEIPCVVVSNEIFDEKTLMLQTVRLNNIRGSLNPDKFNALIDRLVNKHGISFDSLVDELAFEDEDYFNQLVKAGREEIPKEARKEYDKAVKKVNSIDGLAKLIERLWLKYSGTVPANFFIIDYGNLRHLWVQMDPDRMAACTDLFRSIFEEGYKVSSVLQVIFDEFNLPEFMDKYSDRLEKIEEGEETLDDLLDP